MYNTINAKTEVDIVAGRVKVTSTINSLEAYTPKVVGVDATNIADNSGAVKKFGLNGTATIDGDKVILDRMVPGDKITLTYTVANESNVTIKQRDEIKVESGPELAAALKCTYDGNAMAFGKTVWTTKPSADSTIHTVVIELPADVDNVYQDKSCSIRFLSEGVQANAAVKDVFAVKHADGSETGYASLQEAFNEVGNGETVVLNESATITSPVTVDYDNSYSNISFDGNQNNLNLSLLNNQDGLRVYDNLIVKNLNVNGNGRIGLHFLYGTVHTLNNVNVSGKYSSYAVSFTNTCGGTLTDCTVKNSFEGDGAYVDYGCPYVIDVFANRAYTDKVTFVNSDADLVFVNCSGYWEGSNAKVVVDADSAVKTVITASPATSTVVEGAGYAAIEHVYHQVVEDKGLYSDEKEANVYSVVDASGLKLLSDQAEAGISYAEKTVRLIKDVDLKNVNDFKPIGQSVEKAFNVGTFDGNNKTISNMKVTGQAYAGLFGVCNGNIKDLTIDSAIVNSNHYAGALIAYCSNQHYLYSNIIVKNSTITSTPELVGVDEWDNGDKCGGIAGYLSSGPDIKNCQVIDCVIEAYRDLGGIVGVAQSGSEINDNIVKNVILRNNRTHNYKNYTTDAQFDVNEIVGEPMGCTQSGNSFENVTKVVIPAA